MVTPVAKREAVGHLRSAFEVSERRACTVIEVDRTSVRYRVRRADDEPIRVRLRELASQRSLDFASDALSDGRRFRILTIVDDFTRECLALIADTSLSGLRVVRELDALIAVRGCPTICVSDNGTELTSMAVLRWWRENRVER